MNVWNLGTFQSHTSLPIHAKLSNTAMKNSVIIMAFHEGVEEGNRIIIDLKNFK